MNQTYDAPRPNILFILIDDLGAHDLGCCGSTFHETPNIDRLAASGVRFTNAYGQPLCSPARAAILTGIDPARLGLTKPHCHEEQEILEPQLMASAPASQPLLGAQTVTRLDTKDRTLAQSLQDAGYRTAHFGKWHLGPSPYSPLEQGYEVDVPHTHHPSPLHAGFFYPWAVWKDKGKPGDNLEDVLAAEAAAWIKQPRDEPFYLAYWSFQVHSPWMARPDQVDYYRARVNPDDGQRNPVYAGMVQTLDDAVGTLVSALEESGQLENTLIVFMSDHGGCNKSYADASVMPEEFLTTPVTSNSPLRSGKGDIYEGGVRVPLLVSWSGHIEAGSVCDAVVTGTDWYPTLLEILGETAQPDQHFDGASFAPALQGNPVAERPVFIHYPHDDRAGSIVRLGNWKLMRFYQTDNKPVVRHELYNLAEDVGESFNLAVRHPEKVAKLGALLTAHLDEIGAIIPQPNPAWRAP